MACVCALNKHSVYIYVIYNMTIVYASARVYHNGYRVSGIHDNNNIVTVLGFKSFPFRRHRVRGYILYGVRIARN
jgi:hypothetical protein